jgi:hypothetical protein
MRGPSKARTRVVKTSCAVGAQLEQAGEKSRAGKGQYDAESGPELQRANENGAGGPPRLQTEVRDRHHRSPAKKLLRANQALPGMGRAGSPGLGRSAASISVRGNAFSTSFFSIQPRRAICTP